MEDFLQNSTSPGSLGEEASLIITKNFHSSYNWKKSVNLGTQFPSLDVGVYLGRNVVQKYEYDMKDTPGQKNEKRRKKQFEKVEGPVDIYFTSSLLQLL